MPILAERGDTVLVDDPCYFNFHALLRAIEPYRQRSIYTGGADMELFAQLSMSTGLALHHELGNPQPTEPRFHQ